MTDPNAPQQQPAPQQPPAYPAQPQYAPAVVTTEVPGKTLGIVGLVFAFIFSLLGLILSIIAFNQTKAYNRQTGQNLPNTPAKVGIILSAIFLGLTILIWIIAAIVIATTAGAISYSCTVNGVAC